MTEYDNTNSVSIWENESDNAKAPVLKGTVNVDGVDKDISLWVNESEHPKAPKYTGKISEKFVAEAKPAGVVDDNIPF